MSYIKFGIRLIKKFFGKIRRFFSEDSVFYINGTDVLPPPLPKEKESEYIKAISSGDEKDRRDAINVLVEHNLRLVVYIAKRFENTGINIEDLISIGTLGLIKSINTFKNEKNIKLATYASRCIENEILMYIRKNAKSKNDVSLEEPLNVDWDGNELLLSDILGTDEDTVDKNIEKEEEKSVLRSAVRKLNKRDRAIIEMRFGLNDPDGREKTQKDVADTLGISQSYISRLEKRIIENLKKSIISFYK
ncbi:MAG: RNA polymerase sporulation sigma factor SigE [Clostridiales bacterium]|nr:RNA polymerase sporulation sigma factor SigE [Clostridia bacterium]MCR5353917.1 RNA polymerase sporulation sigma factor SigE [Clostridiales bacterium]